MEKNIADTSENGEFHVDDTLVRWIGIPFFGLVIPSASGLLPIGEVSPLVLISSLVYFIFLAFVIWQGNRHLLFRNYPVIFRSQSLLHKYALMLGLNLFYTLPVSALALYVWSWFAFSELVDSNAIWLTVLIIVVCVIFVTNIYEKVLLVKQSEKEILRSEQLERAKLVAELEALKNQIDPHFMFNALNSLSYLIDTDKSKAQLFLENLAEVYRYILKSKDKDLVLLYDEINFMNAYISLLKLRHEKAFHLTMKLESNLGTGYLIPPVSLMVAVENAVKHNEISSRKHLALTIEDLNGRLMISNKIALRKSVKDSTKTGLKNLNERFLKIVGEGIDISQNNEVFVLKLPLLKLSHL